MKKIISIVIGIIVLGLGVLYLQQNGRLWQSGDNASNGVPKIFTRSDCDLMSKDENGVERLIECTTSLSDDFENGIQLTTTKWHKIINQTSGGNAGDKANMLQITTEKAHSGTHSLKTYTSQDKGGLQKSGLARELLFFPAGSDFWYSAWYYIPSGTSLKDLYLFELESTAYHYVGHRLTLGEGDMLYVEAKQDTGNKFYQTSQKTPFPKDRWVNLKMHMKLSSGADGLTEVWQDGKKIIEGQGQNMPMNQYYNWITVGQTANASHEAQTVYVDDVVISGEAI